MRVFCVIFVYTVSLSIIWAENGTNNRGVILTTGRWGYRRSSLILVTGGMEKDYPKLSLENMMIDSCDVDVGRNIIYLFDMQQRRIIVGKNFGLIEGKNSELSFRSDIEFSTVRRVVAREKVQIAVDWVSHNIYWTDPVLGTIMIQPGRRDIPRGLYKVIAHLQEPSGLAVDPLSGYLFWVDETQVLYNKQVKYQIERSSLTGKDRKVVFATSLNKLYALALDVTAKRIYFSIDDFIESSDYDGKARRHISMYAAKTSNFPLQFIDIASYTGRIYAIDRVGNVFRGLHYFMNIRGSSLCVFGEEKQTFAYMNPCDSAGCADICVNEQGTATCLCRDGFDLQENGKDCIEAAGDYHRAIVLNNGTHLCLLPMDVISDNETGSLYCFYRHFNDNETILYVDVDMDTREILFATPYNIYRVAINRTHEAKPEHVQSLGPLGKIRDKRGGQELLYQTHEPYITGLSYNWVSRQLCWSQTRPDGISIIDEERNIMAVTHNNRTSHPRDPVFVLNAKDEHLFWISRLGNETVIETLLVTGDDTEPQVLGEKIHKIKHLQHDVDNKLLVVLSQGEASEKVFYITYRGDEVDSFDLPRHSFAFTQYKDLFLSAGLDEANNTILSLYDRRDKSEVNVHIKEWKGPVLSLNVIDLGVLQPSVPDPCSVSSLGCDQICVPEDDQAKCFCDVGYYLVNTTCETAPVTDNFILVTDFTHGKLYQIPLDKPREVHGIHPPGAVRLQDIAYSANTNEIYLVEETSNEVWTVSVNGVWGVYIANLDEYREEFRGRPRRLVPDPTSNYIYFLSNTIQLDSEILDHHPRYIVGVISPKQYGTSSPRGYSTILYRGYSGFPVDLVLHPKKGMMYWTDDTPKLWRANMDGTNPTLHAADGRSYYGLTIDYQDDMLYWSEYQNAKIYRSGLNGKNIEEFYSDSKSYVNDVNMFGDYLYYSGFTSVHITRVNKHNISDVTTFGPDAGIGTIKSFDIFASNDTVNVTRLAACMVGNGGCSHFCLPRADGKRTCACMYNVKLLLDNRTCDVPKCPTEIPNGRLLDSCSNRALEKCDNFTCDEGFERNKIVDSLICNESGHWSYDGSTLCIPIDKDSDKDKRVLIIGVLAGGSLLIVIVSTVVILYALVRKRKLPAFMYRVRFSKDNVAFENPLFDEQSFTYTEHLNWLRSRINKLLILDEDADKKI